MKRSSMSASPEQRQKLIGARCLICGTSPVDPAHVIPRTAGGCDDPSCVVPLCRAHHREYDQAFLDLLPALEPSYRLELQHAVGHVGLISALQRVTNERWRTA